jgi:hypothetical protein
MAMTPQTELRRLHGPTVPGSEPEGVLITVDVAAPDPQTVLERARDVLEIVIPLTQEQIDLEIDQPRLLPDWFTRACTPPQEEAAGVARWRWWPRRDPETRTGAIHVTWSDAFSPTWSPWRTTSPDMHNAAVGAAPTAAL